MILPDKHFQTSETLSHKLSKGHAFEELKADKPMEICLLVEYATASITNKILLAKYLLYLPDTEQLSQQLDRFLLEEGRQVQLAGLNDDAI